MDLKLDDDNDLIIEDGDLVLTTGSEMVTQRIKQRLKTFYGEWFLDKTIGVPYIQQVFEKGADPIIIETAFKNEILADPAIIELTAFEITLNTTTRELQVVFKAKSTEGPINFDEVLP